MRSRPTRDGEGCQVSSVEARLAPFVCALPSSRFLYSTMDNDTKKASLSHDAVGQLQGTGDTVVCRFTDQGTGRSRCGAPLTGKYCLLFLEGPDHAKNDTVVGDFACEDLGIRRSRPTRRQLGSNFEIAIIFPFCGGIPRCVHT